MYRRIFVTDRSANLEPVFVPGRKKPWRLNLPPKFSPTGKRQQLFFATQDEAESEAKFYRLHRGTFGQVMRSLSPHELSESIRSIDLLRPHGVGLLDAVTAFLDDLKVKQASRSFGAAFEAYKACTSRKSASHLENVRQIERRVQHLFERPIVEVTAHDIEASFAGCSPATFDKRASLLRSVLAYADRKGWCSVNVAAQLDKRADSKRDEVEVYEIEEVLP